jgi:hypothetical protein
MKKATILALVMALVVALMAGTAVAKGKPTGKGSKARGPAVVTYVFKGTVASVAEDGGSVAVEVTGGNKAGRQAAAGQQQPMTFAVTDATKVELNDAPATVPELQPGDQVVVQSKAKKGATSFAARAVSAERPEPAESEPTP